jgi:hypothetical protein
LVHVFISEKARILQFNLTFVYGLHTVAERKGLWQGISNLKNRVYDPWLLLGDFNSVYDSTHRMSGAPSVNLKLKIF